MQHFDTRCNFYFGTQWVENVSEEVLLLKYELAFSQQF